MNKLVQEPVNMVKNLIKIILIMLENAMFWNQRCVWKVKLPNFFFNAMQWLHGEPTILH